MCKGYVSKINATKRIGTKGLIQHNAGTEKPSCKREEEQCRRISRNAT